MFYYLHPATVLQCGVMQSANVHPQIGKMRLEPVFGIRPAGSLWVWVLRCDVIREEAWTRSDREPVALGMRHRAGRLLVARFAVDCLQTRSSGGVR